MGKNIRQLINEQRQDSDTVLLIKQGILSPQGNLTDLGRRVVLDLVFEEGGDIRAEVVSLVKQALGTDEATEAPQE